METLKANYALFGQSSEVLGPAAVAKVRGIPLSNDTICRRIADMVVTFKIGQQYDVEHMRHYESTQGAQPEQEGSLSLNPAQHIVCMNRSSCHIMKVQSSILHY